MGCAQRTQPVPHTCPQGIFWGVSTSLTAQGVHASNAMPSQPELGLSPVQSTRAHSRDKDGVDKVGGIEGGGCAGRCAACRLMLAEQEWHLLGCGAEAPASSPEPGKQMPWGIHCSSHMSKQSSTRGHHVFFSPSHSHQLSSSCSSQ